MGKRRLKLRDLRKILRSFGVQEDSSRGKGGHTLFWIQLRPLRRQDTGRSPDKTPNGESAHSDSDAFP